jgi:uncharacterized protein HemX
MKEFIKKIQGLPEKKRKIILWAIILVLGICLSIFYVKNVSKSIKNFQKEELIEGLNIPSLKEEIEKLPKPEAPQTDELEELMKEIQEQQEQQGQQEQTETGE